MENLLSGIPGVRLHARRINHNPVNREYQAAETIISTDSISGHPHAADNNHMSRKSTLIDTLGTSQPPTPRTIFKTAEANTISPQTNPTIGGTPSAKTALVPILPQVKRKVLHPAPRHRSLIAHPKETQPTRTYLFND